MKKILSTAYTETAFNIATLFLRVVFGLMLCLNHGIAKLSGFNQLKYTFFDPLHIGHKWSLILTIFAEVFCSLLLALGLFSRIAAFILTVNLMVAVFVFNKGQSLKTVELGVAYLTAFFALLLIGPGRYSVDAMTGK